MGLILCGGNIDLMILSSIIQRGLARGGQLARVRIETRDVPGELARVSGLIGAALFGARRMGPSGADLAKAMLRWALYLLAWGFLMSGVNNAAHFGGFVVASLMALASSREAMPYCFRTFSIWPILRS